MLLFLGWFQASLARLLNRFAVVFSLFTRLWLSGDQSPHQLCSLSTGNLGKQRLNCFVVAEWLLISRSVGWGVFCLAGTAQQWYPSISRVECLLVTSAAEKNPPPSEMGWSSSLYCPLWLTQLFQVSYFWWTLKPFMLLLPLSPLLSQPADPRMWHSFSKPLIWIPTSSSCVAFSLLTRFPFYLLESWPPCDPCEPW